MPLANNKIVLSLLLMLAFYLKVKAFGNIDGDSLNSNAIKLEYGINSCLSNGRFSPYFFHTNKSGEIASAPQSILIFAGLSKKALHLNKFTWGFELRPVLANKSAFLSTANVEANYWFANLKIGYISPIRGNQYQNLSAGGMIFSGNARSIPMISISIPKYVAIPYTKGYIEIKGNFDNGVFVAPNSVSNILMHYKDGYVRIGGHFPINISYGIQTAAQWGGNSPNYGKSPISMSDFLRVFLGKSGGSDAVKSEQINVLGNHIVSQNLGFDCKLGKIKINTYWQNINEDGPIRFITQSINRPDMLLGFAIENNYFEYINAILFEYLNTTDQGGPYHDKDGVVYGGSDQYYNNWFYTDGWSNYGNTIGNPLITSPALLNNSFLTFENNVVKAWHLAVTGSFNTYRYRIAYIKSENYGTHVFKLNNSNTSIVIDVFKKMPKSFINEIGLSIGSDRGLLFGDSFGIMLKIKRTIIFNKK